MKSIFPAYMSTKSNFIDILFGPVDANDISC